MLGAVLGLPSGNMIELISISEGFRSGITAMEEITM